MTEKGRLRAEIKERFSRLTADQLTQMSETVCHLAYERVQSCAASTVLLYWSLADEVNTHSLVEKLSQDGCAVLLPVTDGEGVQLRRYCGLESLRAGKFGIMEPEGPIFDTYDAIDLAFIPGRAFTENGARLGRGGGFYDRLLPLLECPCVGLCFDFQVLGDIPEEQHDIPVNEIINN